MTENRPCDIEPCQDDRYKATSDNVFVHTQTTFKGPDGKRICIACMAELICTAVANHDTLSWEHDR